MGGAGACRIELPWEADVWGIWLNFTSISLHGFLHGERRVGDFLQRVECQPGRHVAHDQTCLCHR